MPPKVDQSSLKAILPDKLKRGESAARFFARFDAVCTCLEWTDDAKQAAQVILLFHDDLFDYAISLAEETRLSYKALKAKIIEEVDGGELQESYVRQFQQMTHRTGEDINAFMNKMRRVAKKAYFDLEDDILEPLIMQQFLLGMPSEVRKMVYLHSEKPKTCAGLLELCKKFVQIQAPAEMGACAQVGIEESKLDQVLSKVEALSAEVAAIKTGGTDPKYSVSSAQAMGQSSFRGFRGNCFKCKQYGHTSRDCPLKSSSNVCGMCGNEGHLTADCALSRGKGCRKCGNRGHEESSCRYKGKSLNWS